MKKMLMFASACALVCSLAFNTVALAQDGEAAARLFPVEIRNRTDGTATLVLSGTDVARAYALSVPAGTNRIFTLQEGNYDFTTYACGDSADGALGVGQQLRLVFTACFGDAPNQGAPTIEKVHLTDSPEGKKWRFQYAPPPRPAAPVPGGDGVVACQLFAGPEVTIYNRPDPASSVFAPGPGFTLGFEAQTLDGWLGFDPAYAQAANLGPFHLRWVPPDTEGITGDCAGLPVIWGPPAGICFEMPFTDVQVRTLPDPSAPVAAVLHREVDFAAIVGRTADGDWLKVDLGPGNTGFTVVGWMDANLSNVNGPCGSLPVVAP
jgi:hypothetical protein